MRDGKRFIYFSPTEMRALLFLDNPPPPSPTGGVRCERAGSYLRALSESGAGAWRDKEPPRGIYQLRGGIQAYLEAYGVKRSGGGSATSEILEEDGGDGNNGDRSASISTDRSATKPCLYRGKNFVFDPRRTDPVVGDGITRDVDEASRLTTITTTGALPARRERHDAVAVVSLYSFAILVDWGLDVGASHRDLVTTIAKRISSAAALEHNA